ncbi:MAG: T9SS type A sorting domain-containing protein [Bacteroidetes bacterium]|nr:T9SS type A sorting domain-containing protein [Bacteroidota bacterium]
MEIANANNAKIDISGFDQGIYFFKIISEGNTIQTGKLIKE